MPKLKKIKGYTDYATDRSGNVYSLKFGKTKLLKAGLSGNGKLSVNLSKNGKIRNIGIHTLIAMNYLKDFDDSMYVFHKNGNMLDNRVVNLSIKKTKERERQDERIKNIIDCKSAVIAYNRKIMVFQKFENKSIAKNKGFSDNMIFNVI